MIFQSEKTNPILSAVGGLQMNVNAFSQKDYENEPPSGPKKQTQSVRPALFAKESVDAAPDDALPD